MTFDCLTCLLYDLYNVTYGSLVQHFLLLLSGALCNIQYHTGQPRLHISLYNTAFHSVMIFGKFLLTRVCLEGCCLTEYMLCSFQGDKL